MTNTEKSLIVFSLNQTWNDAHTKLQGNNLGDLEKEMLEKTKIQCKELLMKLDEGKSEMTLSEMVDAYRKVGNIQQDFEADAIAYCKKNKIDELKLSKPVEVYDIVTGKGITVTAVHEDGYLDFEENRDGFLLKCDDISVDDLCLIIEEYVKSKNN